MQPEKILYLLVPGIPVIVTAMFAFDRVVRWQHEFRHADWQKVGSPRGFFWFPEDSLFWRSEGAKQSAFLCWLLRRPVWVGDMQREKRFFIVYRCCSYAWLLGFLLFVAFVVR